MCSLDIAFKAVNQDKPLGKPTNSTGDGVARGVACASTASADTWHRSLGHVNPRSMKLLRKKAAMALTTHTRCRTATFAP